MSLTDGEAELYKAMTEYYNPCAICRFRLVYQHTDKPCLTCSFGVKHGNIFKWQAVISDEDSAIVGGK